MSFNRSSIVFAHDLVAIPCAWFVAYWLRYNLDTQVIPSQISGNALSVLPLLLFVQGSMFWYHGLYRGVWRFASLPDLMRLLKSVFVGVGISAVAIFMFTRMIGIPRSVIPLYGILLIVMLGGSRFVYRWYKDGLFLHPRGQRVLIVGAGKAGEMLIRELSRNLEHRFNPIVMVDDDPNKIGRAIHGVEVQGCTDDMAQLVKSHRIELIVIAIPSANSKQVRKMVGSCENCTIPYRILPKVNDIMAGRVTLNDLREVSIQDLLGRDSVILDWQSIHTSIDGKMILVTGGGGSIGSELCRQVAHLKPKALVVLDNTEFNLYQIELEIKQTYPDLTFVAVLGSVTDRVLVNQVLDLYRPDVIYHAAAYKHVPMLEHNVRQAVVNNIKGTRIMAQAAADFDVNRFVLISTDKAVNPANVMGCSKRISEMICQSYHQQSLTQFVTVRFGNVLGSAGSVVPLFRQQIKRGGPVTVTHKDITRFFMTIPEACQLIMEAGAVCQGGEIYILDMGEPIKVQYLAEQMIHLSGKKLADIGIEYTGLRPGEKLYEELFHQTEDLQETRYNKLLLAKSRVYQGRDLNVLLDELFAQDGDAHILPLILELVPEYSGRTTSN